MPHTPKRVASVEVDVIANPDGGIAITCSPNQADICEGASQVLIVFTLNTTGYRFRTVKAIEMDEAVPDFPYPSWTISDTQAALFDGNQVADTCGYTVTVVNTTTGQEYSVDPEIKNGGGGVGAGDC